MILQCAEIEIFIAKLLLGDTDTRNKHRDLPKKLYQGIVLRKLYSISSLK